MLLRALMVLTAAAALGVSPLEAQVSLDVSKITCEQFTGYKITNPRSIAFWLSGYYNGKRGNTVIDTQELNKRIDALINHCLINPDMPVMQAVEILFKTAK